MRSTSVTRRGPPALPTTVSPSQSPTRERPDASGGRSEISCVALSLPLRSTEPLGCLRFPRCLSLLRIACQPGSSQSRSPAFTARYMVLLLTAMPGSSMRSLPATCSGDQRLSLTRDATSERLAGSSSALGRLQASRLSSALACAVEALYTRLRGVEEAHPFLAISLETVDLSLPISLAIWLTPSWSLQRTMMSSRSPMLRWL